MKLRRFRGVREDRTGHTNLFRRSFTGSGLTRHQKVHFQCFSSGRRRSSSSGRRRSSSSRRRRFPSSRRRREDRTGHTNLFCRSFTGSGLTRHQKVHVNVFLLEEEDLLLPEEEDLLLEEEEEEDLLLLEEEDLLLPEEEDLLLLLLEEEEDLLLPPDEDDLLLPEEDLLPEEEDLLLLEEEDLLPPEEEDLLLLEEEDLLLPEEEDLIMQVQKGAARFNKVRRGSKRFNVCAGSNRTDGPPRTPRKGSPPRTGSVQVQVFWIHRSAMLHEKTPEFCTKKRLNVKTPINCHKGQFFFLGRVGWGEVG